LQTFLDRLAADDLSAATRRGYRYDLLQFIAWYIGLNSAPQSTLFRRPGCEKVAPAGQFEAGVGCL
jgi:hypothetical protein